MTKDDFQQAVTQQLIDKYFSSVELRREVVDLKSFLSGHVDVAMKAAGLAPSTPFTLTPVQAELISCAISDSIENSTVGNWSAAQRDELMALQNRLDEFVPPEL